MMRQVRHCHIATLPLGIAAQGTGSRHFHCLYWVIRRHWATKGKYVWLFGGKFFQSTIESSFLRLSWRYPSYKNSWLSWKARSMAEYFVSRCPIIGHHPWYNSSTKTVPPAPALVRMHSTPTALELMSTMEQPLGLAGLSANTQSTN